MIERELIARKEGKKVKEILEYISKIEGETSISSLTSKYPIVDVTEHRLILEYPVCVLTLLNMNFHDSTRTIIFESGLENKDFNVFNTTDDYVFDEKGIRKIYGIKIICLIEDFDENFRSINELREVFENKGIQVEQYIEHHSYSIPIVHCRPDIFSIG